MTNETTCTCSTPLFGGALVAALPHGLLDASNIRPVPDNQEVFIATATNNQLQQSNATSTQSTQSTQSSITSVVIDILEQPCGADASPTAVVRAHVTEILRLAGTTDIEQLVSTLAVTEIQPPLDARVVFGGAAHLPQMNITVLVLRLGEPLSADIVVTLSGGTLSDASAVAHSFKVVHKSLFGV
ncbi:uncharacterized protein C5L36_0A07070 [Pichia kudriavzevii]|uniref:Uncharacterized protein n=1 Tax=Pichia kudriavzevii TaxID=4909 RepID=A0A2U9QYL2_PICKU|nr:uncharacterized protein C5L36_0A07070 [Pichia kudriavzevii]AWU74104.1 hypothetical protein C5L36_0A07070 [Pichia kudriavzevii]